LNGALVIHDERPQGFCAGLFNSRVYVSSGAVALLDEHALSAVLAPEAHHCAALGSAAARGRRRPRAGLVLRARSRRAGSSPAGPWGARRGRDRDERRPRQSLGAGNARCRPSRSPRPRSAPSESIPDGSITCSESRQAGASRRCCVSLRPPRSGLVGAIAVLAGQVAAGSVTLAPPSLSRQPCIVVLALIPAGVGLGWSASFARREGTASSAADA
jgi:hypothetical protein